MSRAPEPKSAPRSSSAPEPAVLESRNPATGELVGTVQVTSAQGVEDAVARAQAALPAWRALSVDERAQALGRVASAAASQAEALGQRITQEMGKPLRAAVGEAQSVAPSLTELDDWVEVLRPQLLTDGALRTRVVRDPLGVVAVITPWNFPASMAQAMLVPALLAGNTVVTKPSEETPLTGALLHSFYAQALPPGVCELVQGGDQVGRALVAAPVQMIAFVGSQAAGKSIMAAAASDLKRLVLELGGKDPMVVLDDADLEHAAEFAVHGAFRKAGQVCVSVERVYIDGAVAERFTQHALEYARRYKVGPGTEEGIDMGPMVSAGGRARVIDQLDDARRRGAQVEHGGKAIDGPGHFMEPTVVTGVDDTMLLMRDETFGPVLAIQTVASPEEAVARANSGSFGLGATLWSGNPERAARYGSMLDAGMVGINRSIGGVAGTPWVGAKQSGFGYTGSPEAVLQFTQTRKVSWSE